MDVRIKLLHPSAIVPVQRPGDSGADLHAIHGEVLYPGQTARVNFGLALEIPDGFEGQIRPRSGLASKQAYEKSHGKLATPSQEAPQSGGAGEDDITF